jgi:hypothetical protein
VGECGPEGPPVPADIAEQRAREEAGAPAPAPAPGPPPATTPAQAPAAGPRPVAPEPPQESAPVPVTDQPAPGPGRAGLRMIPEPAADRPGGDLSLHTGPSGVISSRGLSHGDLAIDGPASQRPSAPRARG